ncbi:hypothetical protein C5N14_05005 [Micromonospora sp. MW-13]|uniref:YqeB family protein n=1 Tax=Micromonospora sp. MW-13 TaxID=2094022 RepID=UPI000EE0BFF4|nr:hypothetical protein [Micromonospora sp. MW-13]RGC69765.1 hypothetical protein C5N14_05005 [Micromonospora sp. MW-13]
MRAGDVPTRVDGGAGELAVMWGGFPLLGAGAGWLLTAVAGPVAGLPWAPAQGWFELLARLPEPRATIGALALGALAGLVVAGIGTRERLLVEVYADRVRLRHDGREREVSRRAVRVVFVDRRDLVLLGDAEEELARERGDLSAGRLAAAFRAHGWPWADADPHRDAYRRWVDGLPGLPVGADALLRARQRAVDRGRRAEADDLRRELARLGVVVRDEEKRQYWRPTRRADPG